MRHASAIIIATVRSLIVDVAMGQIPRSTECISSYLISCLITQHHILADVFCKMTNSDVLNFTVNIFCYVYNVKIVIRFVEHWAPGFCFLPFMYHLSSLSHTVQGESVRSSPKLYFPISQKRLGISTKNLHISSAFSTTCNR